MYVSFLCVLVVMLYTHTFIIYILNITVSAMSFPKMCLYVDVCACMRVCVHVV